jgi:hypothetical protein
VTATRITAAEEIQAAIVKLSASRLYLVACPEFQYSAVRHIARNCDMEHECESESEECGWDRYQTAPAFDMLTRTIDAQLTILSYGLSVHNGKYSDPTPPVENYALALARAINGPA